VSGAIARRNDVLCALETALTHEPSKPKQHTLLIGVVLVCVAAYSLVIVLKDNRPLRFDSVDNLVSTVVLARALSTRASVDVDRWLSMMKYRPPVPAIVSQPAAWLMANRVIAIRITDLAALLLCVWFVYRLGIRLSGPTAGLVAAFLFAAFPLVQSWGRMGNGDPVIWLSLLLLFRLTLDLDLRSPWQGTAFGVGIGLCMLTRLLTLIYLIAPVVWVVLYKARTRRSWLILCAAGAWALATSGWWYLLQHKAVVHNISASAQGEFGPDQYLRIYWWMGGIVVAVVVAWRSRLLSRAHTMLFALWLAVPAAQLLCVWTFWERYPLPMFPQCAVLVGVVLDRLLARASRARRRVVWVVVVGLGMLPLLCWHLLDARWRDSGLVYADSRPYVGMERALDAMPTGEPFLLINGAFIPTFALGQFLSRPRRVHVAIDPNDEITFNRHLNTPVSYVLMVRGDGGPSTRRANASWTKIRRLLPGFRTVRRFLDPDRTEYHLARLPRPTRIEALAL
jgi:hypothetical protein